MGELRNWTIISLAGAVWLALIAVGAVAGKPEEFKTISEVVPIVLLVLGFFEQWVWRWAFFPRLVGVPVLHGTWRGELQSLWKDPATGAALAKKTVYLSVEQTMTSICVRLMSDESASEQVAGSLVRPRSGPRVVSAVYLNTPTAVHRGTSPMHYGAIVLRVSGAFPAGRLEGDYWTDRQSKGSLVFDLHRSGAADSFTAAAALFAF